MKSFFTFLLLLTLGAAHAQNSVEFSGKVVDSTGLGLGMVSVAFLDPADSTLKAYAITDWDGLFKSNSVPEGKYLMQISFLGYETISRKLAVDPDSKSENLGVFVMQPALNVLSEVVVSGQRIPIVINKDTVEYNASSFRVNPDDNVEDLLKRLPGIEVDRDGKITAQGEEVAEVLVDGKKFFGSDATIATRNIPADAINKVKVYDKQSEDAAFTGVDDGVRNKTIDLELKEDRKKGVFGYAEGGGGTEERFLGKAGVHRFTPTTRLSFLGNINNINDYGFSFGDYRDMAGDNSGVYVFNSSDAMPMGWSGPDDGRFLSGATGLNLNWDPSKAHQLSSSYFFTHLNNDLESSFISEEFINDEQLSSLTEENSHSLANGHRLDLSHRSDLDSMNRIEFVGDARINYGFSTGDVVERRYLSNGDILQDSRRSHTSENRSASANGGLTYTHKFNKKGRNIKFFGSWGLNEMRGLSEWRSDNKFPLKSEEDSLFQSRDDLNRDVTRSVSATFNEPLSEKHFLELNTGISAVDESLVRNTTDVYSGGFDPQYSPDFELINRTYNATLAYKFINDKHHVEASVRTIQFEQSASEHRLSTEIPLRKFIFAMPSVSWNWNPSPAKRFSASYYTDYSTPGLTQLLTVEDISNPLVVRKGNPNLKPTYNHRFWSSYNNWNAFDQTSFNVSLGMGYSANSIITHQEIDSQYVRIFTPENFDQPTYDISLSTRYRFPLKFIKWRSSVGLRTSHRQNPGMINNELNQQDNTNVRLSLDFRTDNNEIWDFNIGGNVSFNWSSYSLQENFDQQYINQEYYANIEYTPIKRFGVETGMRANIYGNASFADRQVIPVWNANVYYNLSKEGTMQFKLTVYDILDQNRGVSRYSSMNAIVERTINSLGRYAMLTFLYKFKQI